MSVNCAQHLHVAGTCQRTTGRYGDGCTRYCDEQAGGPIGWKCEGQLRTALAELPDLWQQIAADLTPGVYARGANVSGGGNSAPLPIDSAAQALLDSIAWWTRLFEDEVRSRAGLVEVSAGLQVRWLAAEFVGPLLPDGSFRSPQARERAAMMPDAVTKPRTARAVLASCSLIGRNLPVLLAIPPGTTVYDGDRDLWVDTSGLDAAERLLHLQALARARLGQVRAVHRHPDVPCMDCGAYAITRQDGQETRRCEACGAEYDLDAWDAHLAWLERWVKHGAREASVG